MAASTVHAVLNAIDEPALIVEQGRVTAANGAALALFGAGIEDRDVRLAIRHPAALATIQRGRTADLELTGIGTAERPWLLSVRRLSGSNILVRLADRSATRSAERMRVDFVANASHELRTPLTTILGYSDTIADGDCGAQDSARFASIIAGEARRMLRIVEDLMSLSRIEADRYNPPTEEIDPAELVALAGADGHELATRRGCRIETEAAPDLAKIRGDFSQLLQMLDNIVANAIRYGCPSPGATIRIAAHNDGESVIFTVIDSGEGIAADHLPRLTERFYRVDEARSRDSGGTGLGLAIVKHIVERHRGTLTIRSRRGAGTTVSVRLPTA